MFPLGVLGHHTEDFKQILSDIHSHLAPQPHLYSRFLTLAERLRVTKLPSSHVEQIIEEVASILMAVPLLFYRLNPLFHPDARVEFDTRSPLVTSFVLRVREASRIVNLSRSRDISPLELHNLSALQFGEILTHGVAEGLTKEDLRSITNSPLLDCLAQLAQDLIDNPKTSKILQKQALQFLRRPAGVPPSLLLHNIKEHSAFDFTCLSDLFKGTFDGLQVIIKKPRICKDSLNSSEIIREIILCRQLHHPNILPFLGVTFDEQYRLYGLVTPFMKNGNVTKFLEAHPNIDRVTPIWQITKGLEFLHRLDPPIAHRDIKGANVLVNDKLVCCLADFGLSSIPEISQRSRKQAFGTLHWMAPEILYGLEGVDLFKADVFSLGITVLEIYTGEPPNRFAQQDLQPCLPPICPHHFPSYLNELVSKMLDDPYERPPARLVCQALEDNLVFPREIEIGVSKLDATTQTTSTDYMSARDVAQAWVTKEREREELEKNDPDPLRNTTQQDTLDITRTMSPLPDFDSCRSFSTPVIGALPSEIAIPLVTLNETPLRPPMSTKKSHSLGLPTPPDSPENNHEIPPPRSVRLRPIRSLDDMLHSKSAVPT